LTKTAEVWLMTSTISSVLHDFAQYHVGPSFTVRFF